jgi:hypothetical protein
MVKLRLTFPLLLCVLAAGCGIKTWRFEPSPGNFIDRELPWRVGVITDKAFNPYQIRFGYWSAPTFTWSMEGLPDAFTYTLKQQFRSAETLPAGRGITPERHDLAGKMSVDHLHFEGAKTSTGRDRVEMSDV